MEFGSRSSRGGGATLKQREIRKLTKAALNDVSDHFGDASKELLRARYPSPLQFYDVSPKNQIQLEQFEELALERLQLLRVFEKHSSMSTTKFTKEWKENIDKDLKKNGIEWFDQVFDHPNTPFLFNRQKDHFSHFILRLAYCRTEDLRRWFITQEVEFFRYRCMGTGSDEIKDFMTNNDLKFIPIDEEEKKIHIENLQQCMPPFGGLSASNSNFYKVHFTEALDLVRNRRVFIKNGMCYVPEQDMVSLLTWMFKSLLAQNLALTAKTLPNLDEDERLVRMLSDIDKRYTGADYSKPKGDSITPDMIKPLSEKSFPMCMRSMQECLNSTNHLKYKARLQYGLFLKGIGLSLEDAIRFFRGHFTKGNVDADKFDKEYAYGIRYNYGKEGKKVNWAPWTCMRTIMETVGPGENHGCPYRHHDPEALRSLLMKSGVEGENLKEVMQAAKDGHYQRACALQYTATHNGLEMSTGITNHPNQFYQESISGGKGTNQSAQKSNVKTERGVVYSK